MSMKEKFKLFLWGALVGAIVLLIIIFSTGWMMTSGSAQRMAQEIANEAVADRLAPICVEQFLKDPNKEERLEELKKLDSWNRADYVKKQGWATMPGEKEPDYQVADECAKLLMELKK